jgi:hypothetical protein
MAKEIVSQDWNFSQISRTTVIYLFSYTQISRLSSSQSEFATILVSMEYLSNTFPLLPSAAGYLHFWICQILTPPVPVEFS